MGTAIDLFCGCGGFSLGARLAGLELQASVDIDKTLSSSYVSNFPSSQLLNNDLLELPPEELRKSIGPDRLTAIIGGPPCQGFSVMGRRNIDDPRNALLKRYFEFVAALTPRFFVMENVPGLNDSKNRPVLDAALELVPQGYRVLDPVILDAADYGAATSRPRLVVVGYDASELDHLTLEDLRAAQVQNKARVRDAIEDLPGPSKNNEWRKYRGNIEPSVYAVSLRQLPPTGLGAAAAVEKLKHGYLNGFQETAHSVEVVSRFDALPPGQRDPISKYPKLSWDKNAFVLRAGTGSDKGSFQAARPIHPEQPRVITVREAARIQGFPDWFQFHPTKWHSHRMIGNSVSPIFARALLEVVLSKMGINRRLQAAE